MRFNYIKKNCLLYVLYTLRKGFWKKKKKFVDDNLEFDGWNYLTDVHEKRTQRRASVGQSLSRSLS